jgi:NAD(P)-dependent dehydrogenase (short-subunit alcohol dehydrogenase family)
MDLALAGKVVLVTGATGGIGQAAAHALAAEGARLALQGRTADKLGDLCAALGAPREGNTDARGYPVDLEPPDAAARLVEAVLADCGRLDILVACAGAARGGRFDDMDDAMWRANLELKLFATLRVLRAALAPMRAAKSGRIVLVIGNSAREPEASMLPGAVANAGLLALTRGLARDIAADGIVINAVNPGPVHSERWEHMMNAEAERSGRPRAEVEAPHLERIPLRRLARAEEVARHIVFLASERAGHMTGTSVLIDGGAARGIG